MANDKRSLRDYYYSGAPIYHFLFTIIIFKYFNILNKY